MRYLSDLRNTLDVVGRKSESRRLNLPAQEEEMSIAIFTGSLQLGCEGESYDFCSSPFVLSLRSDSPVSRKEWLVVQLAAR